MSSVLLAGLIAGAVESAVPTRTIVPGVEMPIVSLGSGGGSESLNVTEYVREWLSLGGRGIDTAWIYKDEDRVASGIAAAGVKREDLFITTKSMGQNYSDTVEQIQANLALLQTDYIDLQLLHFPVHHYNASATKLQDQENWRALEDLYHKGVFRSIGVSNFMVDDLQNLAETQRIVPMVNQMQLYVGNHLYDDVIAYCLDKSITYEAYSPLGQGQVLNLPELLSIGAAHNKSSAQVALRWIVQRPEKMVLTVQSHDEQYDVEDMNIFDFELTQTEMTTLNQINLTVFN
jgi:diketogulonate reductase-like aldo/keto reductase